MDKNVINNRRYSEVSDSKNKSARKHKKSTSSGQSQLRTKKTASNNLRRSQPLSSQNKTKSNNGKRPTRKKHHFFKKFLILVVSLIVICYVVAFLFVKISPLNSDISSKADAYHISDEAAAIAQNHDTVNVLIFGLDGRDNVEGDRSDTIMIASADFETGDIKITSLMRDTYTYINDTYGYDKLNSAYSYGGSDQAITTINENFDTAITDYVTVDFTCTTEMVDAVGGVTVNIESQDELDWVNIYLADVNTQLGTYSENVPGIGEQVLNGNQALAYCRIRYVGNGDFDRTERQRVVMEQVLQKALDLNPIAQFHLIQEVLPYVDTSLSNREFITYLANVFFMHDYTIEQDRLPTDEYVGTDLLYGVSYVFPDTLVDNIKQWYQFVYGIDYTPSSRAQSISDEINYAW